MCKETIEWDYHIAQIWESENPAQWLKDYHTAGWGLVSATVERRWRGPRRGQSLYRGQNPPRRGRWLIKRETHYTFVLKFPWETLWDYHVIWLFEHEYLKDVLRVNGVEGWELVHVTEERRLYSSPGYIRGLVFRRLLES